MIYSVYLAGGIGVLNSESYHSFYTDIIKYMHPIPLPPPHRTDDWIEHGAFQSSRSWLLSLSRVLLFARLTLLALVSVYGRCGGNKRGIARGEVMVGPPPIHCPQSTH